MESRTYRNALKTGTVYGLVLGIILLYWIQGTIYWFLGGMMPIASALLFGRNDQICHLFCGCRGSGPVHTPI
ncbi:MAG: hypothetical protein KL787_00345 [Taibaiella sp.]|nr:hypothetical protein [Taibaiella sp.]